MEGKQKIRFCTGADGVRLAIATVGEGPPLVRAATWLTHVEMDPLSLVSRHWIAELGRIKFFVRYDSRGCGLSDRKVERISLEAWIEDLEAVVDTLDIASFPLLGI